MSAAVWFLVGGVVGAVVVARLRENESSCCRRVAAGVREHVVDALGSAGGTAYDLLGLGGIAPAVLDALGVAP